ncbi:MAG TPA: glycosyltransferase family 2 protein [Candidatus Scatomonas pullistercoris]|uniref:Glycosyltransferase family 2 protein n=1 Tax=Candidatus Scatomonas pullistercoris TaxID=2840920 RepID=A0A9D1P1N7_9FIRM|nr:glycosyltransferase family 2 protein [Candidatus Scatomonas pullistercoris]
MVGFIQIFNFILLLLFSGCYLYQVVYVFIGLFKKDREAPAHAEMHKYAVLIPARNEETVIGGLLESIRKQDYPQELISVYVIADNCTDGTAECAEQYGAKVIRRFNHVQVGKGYALDYALKRIDEEQGIDSYDGFLVFDADNVLDSHYFTAMNKTFSQGYEIITSYRNSKNYGTNWLTAGYGLWFIRESRFLNGARMKAGTSCAISGTGFLVSTKVIREDGGWKYHLLTEDIEFSTDHIIRGYNIGYCKDAILYDEQPVTFRASWNQRLRWTKGFYQVFARYGKGLVSGIFKRRSFQCYDMLMVIAPATLITLTSLSANLVFALTGLLTENLIMAETAAASLGGCLISIYASLFLFGTVTLLAEQKRIYCPKWKQILYLFTFPVFIFTYIPMAVAALRRKVTWTRIPHTILCSADQICSKK